MKKGHIRAPKKFYARAAVIGTIAAIAIIWRVMGNVSPYLLYLISASFVTFILYGFDKMQAKRNAGRVPEIVLHLITLAGGVTGGWAGRFVFRHKTRKPVFLIVLILASVLHALLFYHFI